MTENELYDEEPEKLKSDVSQKADRSHHLEDSTDVLLYNVDTEYHSLYTKGVISSGTPDSGEKRKIRFFNLIQFLMATADLKGHIVECGSWKGLSSFLMCHYLQKDKHSFMGENYHIVDSFEGLSTSTEEDIINRDLILKGMQRNGKIFKEAGAYSGDKESVQQLLSSYPNIQYHKGWIPDVFNGMKKHKYKFAHIDLDIYEPISHTLNYLYPLMVPGGIIVCDDYGSMFWPGAQKAVDEFCKQKNIRVITLSSGQAIIIKPSPWQILRRKWKG